jgi:hypothetical protein
MSVCAYVCVCMYVCVCVCMYVCMYVCIHICMYACIHGCIRVEVPMHAWHRFIYLHSHDQPGDIFPVM